MAEFTPPAIPVGVDVLEHVFATRRAIQAWHRESIDFLKITLCHEVRFILMADPRLQRGLALREPQLNTMWGMEIELSETKNDRTYTIAYELRQ